MIGSEMYELGGSNFAAWLQQDLDVSNEAAGIELSGVQDAERLRRWISWRETPRAARRT